MQRVAAVQVFFFALKRRLMSTWGNALRMHRPTIASTESAISWWN
jgi:hypothetical protein